MKTRLKNLQEKNMERQNKNYFNQQANTTFQPQTYRQSDFERVNPRRTEMHSSFIPSNGDSIRDSIYKMKAGDTLWDIAEDKLGSGSRWTELKKKDGSAFTKQKAPRLQIGTSVYLPEIESANSLGLAPKIRVKPNDSGANPNKMALGGVGNGDRAINLLRADNSLFTQPKSAYFSGANLIKAVQSNPEGVSYQKLTGGARSAKFPGSNISSAAFYEISERSSPQIQESVSYRRLADSSPLAQGNTLPSGASDDRNLLGLSENEYLAQHIAGDAAAGYLMGDLATKLGKSNIKLRDALPDAWAAKQGLQPWSTAWTGNGQEQFRDNMSELIGRKIKENPKSPLKEFVEMKWELKPEHQAGDLANSPLKEFVEKDKHGKWKLKPQYQAGDLADSQLEEFVEGELKLKPEYHAGHTGSKTSGTREMFAIEHKDRNLGTSSEEKKLKQQGTFLRKRAVSIDGVPVEIQTARDKLPKSVVDNARVHPGWARTSPVGKREVDRIRNRLYSKQLKNELKHLREVQGRSPVQQSRLKQLEGMEDQIKKGSANAPSTNALTDPHDQKAIRRFEGMVARANNTLWGKWRGTKVTDKSVDVVRDHLIRSELQENKNLSPKDIRELQRKLAAGTATDVDLAKLNPQSKAQVGKLRDIVKDIAANPNKRPFHGRSGRELYAFYDEKLRDSVTHTKNPASGQDVTDSRQAGASKQRGGKAQFIAHRDKPNEANPEKKRSVNPADRSPRQTETNRVVRSSNQSPEIQRPKSSVVSTTATSRNNEGSSPRTRSPKIEPEVRKPPATPSGAKTIAKSGGKVLGKFVKPLGFAVDAYEVGNAMYKDGGIGKNTKKVAKDAAVSWGSAAAGAATGAAIGSVVPVIGTGVGAVVGGIAGGLAPDAVKHGPKLAKKVGSFVKGLFD